MNIRLLAPAAALAPVLCASTALAQEAASIDATINETVAAFTGPFVSFIFAPIPAPPSRGSCCGWSSLRPSSPSISGSSSSAPSHAIALVSGKYSDPNDAGEVSHFQALATALSGTVGLGNIAGVAVAVSIGGPGATFWMILAGLMGMASKFTECTLGVKYRNEYPDGTVSGGPMYYLNKGMTRAGPARRDRQGSGDPVLDLLRARRAGRRQHVPGQSGPCADLRDHRRLSGLDHRRHLCGHRLRGDRRRPQIHRAGDREGRAVHGASSMSARR
jgi:hypothetical protein